MPLIRTHGLEVVIAGGGIDVKVGRFVFGVWVRSNGVRMGTDP